MKHCACEFLDTYLYFQLEKTSCAFLHLCHYPQQKLRPFYLHLRCQLQERLFCVHREELGGRAEWEQRGRAGGSGERRRETGGGVGQGQREGRWRKGSEEVKGVEGEIQTIGTACDICTCTLTWIEITV